MMRLLLRSIALASLVLSAWSASLEGMRFCSENAFVAINEGYAVKLNLVWSKIHMNY